MINFQRIINLVTFVTLLSSYSSASETSNKGQADEVTISVHQLVKSGYIQTNISDSHKKSEECATVCIHTLNPDQGCDFFRLRERIPHLRHCITGLAKDCPRPFTSYCWNSADAEMIGFYSKSITPVCDDEGYTCDDTTVAMKDLMSMNCQCSVKCEETC